MARSLRRSVTAGFVACLIGNAAPAFAQAPGPGGHPYDPCAMVSKQDVASALGVATEQVFTPQAPTKNECVWSVAAHTGVPGRQAALTLQTIDAVKHAHGLGLLAPVLQAAHQFPGAATTSDRMNRALDDAEAVADLGDRAGWKNSTLTVAKKELLLQVSVDGASDPVNLRVAKTIAQTALQHLPAESPK